MVPLILRKIRRNGCGLSVASVIVHARLLFAKTTYWVAVIVMPDAEVIVYSLFIPASPRMVASLSTRTCAPICAD
jgi:hypothetical protein